MTAAGDVVAAVAPTGADTPEPRDRNANPPAPAAAATATPTPASSQRRFGGADVIWPGAIDSPAALENVVTGGMPGLDTIVGARAIAALAPRAAPARQPRALPLAAPSNARENSVMVAKRPICVLESARRSTSSTWLGSPGFMLASGDGAWWITWYSSDATFSPTNGGLPPTSS